MTQGQEGRKERPSDATFMQIASDWINDPMGTREKFVANVIGPNSSERPAKLDAVLDAMRMATISHASALAWVRGEKQVTFGPPFVCASCNNFIETATKSKMDQPLIVGSIWLGRETGGWCCGIYGCQAEFQIAIPDPVIPSDMKELAN